MVILTTIDATLLAKEPFVIQDAFIASGGVTVRLCPKTINVKDLKGKRAEGFKESFPVHLYNIKLFYIIIVVVFDCQSSFRVYVIVLHNNLSTPTTIRPYVLAGSWRVF